MPENDGTLVLEMHDTNGRPLPEKVDVILRHRILSDVRRYSSVKTSPFPKMSELRRAPQGLYIVEIDPPSYRCVQQFINIGPSGDTRIRLTFPIDPRKVRDVRFPEFSALSSELQRILSASNAMLGQVGKVGSDLFESLDPIRKAGLLNIVAKTSATALQGGRMVIEHIHKITELRGDRFFASVTKELREEARHGMLAGLFVGASGSLHHPPEGYSSAGSFKSNDRYGNLQLTFFVKDDEWVADIDIDDASGLEHVFQVVRNSINGPTHPYDIREILLAHQQLDAGYELVV